MSRYSRNKTNLRQIEGRHSVIETLLSNKKVSYIDLSDSNDSGSQIEKIKDLANSKNISVNLISKKSIEKKSATKKSQGVILYLDDNYQSSVEDMIFLADKKKEIPLIIFLDRVQDPHNLGAIARTAEIFGAHGLVVPAKDSAKISPGAIRASAGALEHIEFTIVNSISKTLEYLKKMNFQVFSLDMDGENIKDIKINNKIPIALVVGSEHDGISKRIIDTSDKILSVPMKGEISSLNVSVATGIILYELFSKRNLSG
ncbi:MAG: 23S rRNA (guanosine(2251)-2'-O)-methyltransferase RlmB [Dehalococcoidia bacterium]|nr:23S rRNA (guanosine(2251)-2'-O)-methyltransferase RlmB [Chloroflexota bacterium]OUW95445.1 MAG: 23S rRNA (guanosine(2251)-2'-O)-methyltransferase RlmB [Chloroflexi bacterium TMED230]RZP13648.1 MAG: 23S rRNA (guanosine(2251)-2'-O)-methyltransferase RlmB [Chloroflexota bacterium]